MLIHLPRFSFTPRHHPVPKALLAAGVSLLFLTMLGTVTLYHGANHLPQAGSASTAQFTDTVGDSPLVAALVAGPPANASSPHDSSPAGDIRWGQAPRGEIAARDVCDEWDYATGVDCRPEGETPPVLDETPVATEETPVADGSPAVESARERLSSRGGTRPWSETAEEASPEPEAAQIPATPPEPTTADIALQYVGYRYAWAGASPSVGFDCSGLAYYSYSQKGIILPRDSFSQFLVGTRVPRDELQPGDLVFFTTYAYGASHVGIYVGDEQFVHAADYGVAVDSLYQSNWARSYLGARRP